MGGKRILGLGFVTAIILIISSFIGVSIYEKKQTEKIDEFFTLIEEAHRDRIAKQILIGYESEILNQLENVKNRIQLRQIYFGLGYIEKFKGNPTKSNEYLFKAIRLGQIRHRELNVMIYKLISFNYLEIGDVEKSQEFFQKAEAIARGYSDNKLLARVYRSRAYWLIKEGKNYEESIDLLQKALYLSSDPINHIHASLQLAEIYLNTFTPELAINYSVKALELAIKNDVESYQKISLIALGTAHYLNEQYEKSITIFENVLNNFPDYRITEYLPMVIMGYLYTSGIDEAIDQLESYQSLVTEMAFIGDADRTEKWMNTLKSSIHLENDQVELALQYWIKGEDSYEGELDEIYQVWRNSIYFLIQFDPSLHEVEISQKFHHLYKILVGYSNYPSLKIGILKRMINHSVELGNYEVAYKYMQEIVNNFTRENPEGISVEDLYEWLHNEINLLTAEQKHITFWKWFVQINLWIVIGYILIHYYQKNKMLEKKLANQRWIEPVTSVLTLPAFYHVLEIWCELNKEVYFLVIDIDCFEKYNQTYGKLAGERILQELAQCILKYYPDGVVTRINGCQFIVVIEGDKEEITFKAQQLIELVYNLNLNHVTNLEDDRITISIGISNGNINSKLQVDRHIETAQKCLKEAKQKGKNTFVI